MKSRGTPIHLVEFGAGDGLNLIADYRERGALLTGSGEALPVPEGYADSPYPVLSRTGFIDAKIFPDRVVASRLPSRGAEAPAPASDGLYVALSRESSGPRLLECPAGEMPARAAAIVPARAEQGVLAYNFGLTETMTEQAYGAFRAGVGEWLESWGDVGFWAELEKPRGVAAPARELIIHRWKDGEFRSAVLGRLEESGSFLVLEGWGFLQPLAPVRPQRVTIEEPPRMIRPAK